MLLLRKADLKARSQRGDALLFRQLPLTLPASTLAFAIAHTSNWDIGRDALWTLPLAVMPQFISGLAFAYARMRSGLHVAMGLHASLNLLVVLVGWAVQQA
jgi:membrane protease YdiL (CAAX protease family)